MAHLASWDFQDFQDGPSAATMHWIVESYIVIKQCSTIKMQTPDNTLPTLRDMHVSLVSIDYNQRHDFHCRHLLVVVVWRIECQDQHQPSKVQMASWSDQWNLCGGRLGGIQVKEMFGNKKTVRSLLSSCQMTAFLLMPFLHSIYFSSHGARTHISMRGIFCCCNFIH